MEYLRDKQIKEGGEGYIFEVKDHPELLMKIYKEFDVQGDRILTEELVSKLEYMKSNPPKELIDKGIIAWPIKFVYENEKIVGFVMPRLKFDCQLLYAYSYKHPISDKETYEMFPSTKARIGLAINLAVTIDRLHAYNYVVGDLNHENIGIDRETAAVNVVDCDSFHITFKDGSVMRTNVIMPGYLAPEIIKHCDEEKKQGRPYTLDKVALPTFTKSSDLFCLAVHIFKLLMNGVDPFKGVLEETTGSMAAPFQGNEAIKRNSYVFKEGYKPSAVFCLKLEELPPVLGALFKTAFVDGNKNPEIRPSAKMWYTALMEYYNSLIPCSSNKCHYYYKELSYCPFCEADKRYEAILKNGISTKSYMSSLSKAKSRKNRTLGKKQKDEKIKTHKGIREKLWIVPIMLILLLTLLGTAHSYTVNNIIAFTSDSCEVEVGEYKELKVRINTCFADTDSVYDLYWYSEDPSIVTVDVGGGMIGLSAGSTVIHVQTLDGEYETSCEVTVK